MRSLHELLVGAIDGQGPDAASRCGVLAALGVAAAFPVALGVDALARVKGEGNNHEKKRRTKRKKDKKGDIAILNYALTLEHLEYAFYCDGLTTYGAGDFPAGVYDRLKEIRDHEKAHVAALTQTIQGMGGAPVAEACSDFGSTMSAQFLEVARCWRTPASAPMTEPSPASRTVTCRPSAQPSPRLKRVTPPT